MNERQETVILVTNAESVVFGDFLLAVLQYKKGQKNSPKPWVLFKYLV